MGRQRRPALAAGLCAAVAVAVVAVMLIGTRWHGGGAMRDTELAAAVVSGPQVIYLKRARGIGGADAKTTALEGDADAADDAEEGGEAPAASSALKRPEGDAGAPCVGPPGREAAALTSSSSMLPPRNRRIAT